MKKTAFLFAATLMLAACSKEEQSDPSVIRLSANVSGGIATTRTVGTAAELQNAQFVSGASIHVEAYETGQSTSYSSGAYTTTDGNGTMSGSLNYPASGNNVDILAYYPNSINSSSNSFSVQANQTSLTNYRGSDLMYADKLSNLDKTSTNPHALTFHHVMAKIIVNISPDATAGITAQDITDNISAVTIKNTILTANLVPNTNNGQIAVTAASGTTSDIAILGTGGAASHGLIVPQVLTANTEFISVTYNGTTHTYALPANKTFTGGQSYIYNFTISAAGIRLVSTEITDWQDPDSGNSGSATFII